MIHQDNANSCLQPNRKRQTAEKEQQEQEINELNALSDRNEVTATLLNDIDDLDKKLQELQLIRDTIYAVPGAQDLVYDEKRAYWSQASQAGLFSQDTTQALAKLYEREARSPGPRVILASSSPLPQSRGSQGNQGGDDGPSTPIPDSARDEGPDDLYNVTPKR